MLPYLVDVCPNDRRLWRISELERRERRIDIDRPRLPETKSAIHRLRKIAPLVADAGIISDKKDVAISAFRVTWTVTTNKERRIIHFVSDTNTALVVHCVVSLPLHLTCLITMRSGIEAWRANWYSIRLVRVQHVHAHSACTKDTVYVELPS